MHLLIIVLVFFFIKNSIDKTLSVNLCEKNGKLKPIFAEIFGQKWDNEKMECENENETDQNANYHQNDQNELNSADSISSDQNNQLDDQQKFEIVYKFHAIKERIKKKGKYSAKMQNKIEQKIAENLGIKRTKIYKWKKEIGFVYENIFYKQKKQEFIERIDEIKRMPKYGKQKKFAKELGIDRKTLYQWKKEFGIQIGIKYAKRFSNNEKMCKMNDYYKMKNENPSLTDKEIAGLLKISVSTLKIWKKETKS